MYIIFFFLQLISANKPKALTTEAKKNAPKLRIYVKKKESRNRERQNTLPWQRASIMVNWPKAAYRKRFGNLVPTHTHTQTDERARRHNKQLIQFEMAIISDKLLLVILFVLKISHIVFNCKTSFHISRQLSGKMQNWDQSAQIK